MFNTKLSPYKWEILVGYKYFNIFFSDFVITSPKFMIKYSADYIAFVNFDGKKKGIALYQRFVKSHVLDFFAFEESSFDTMVNIPMVVFISTDEQEVTILGMNTSNDTLMLKTIIELKTLKINVRDPHKYIDMKLNFDVSFLNGRKIQMNFIIRDGTQLKLEVNKSQSYLLWFMKILLTLLTLCIFGSLGYLVKIARQKNAIDPNNEMLSASSSRVDDIINPQKLSVGQL